jgi:dihydroflavonol-4-reductase
MKVLITGANGFLASNVIRELMARNIEVRGMLREKCNEKSLKGLNIECIRGNIVNYYDVHSAIEGCDVVIHTAGDTSQLYTNPLPLFPANVNGTSNIVMAAKELNVQRLIFVSTANTIGLSAKKALKRNNISKYYQKSGYALSKLIAEEIILKETKIGNLNAIIVNPTFMIGAFDAKPSSGRIIIHFLKNKLALYPRGGKNFIDVKSAATAICNAIESGQSGNKYVLSGENLSYKEFLNLLNMVETRRSFNILIPSFLLIAAGLMGSLLRIIGLKSELNYYNAKILTSQETISGENAENELLMPKTNVLNAIQDAVTWFKENGYLS